MPNAKDRRRTHPVRVLLADDHPLFAETLSVLLGADDRIEVVGYAENGVEAVELARRLCPHVVLMDVHMPVLDGIEASRALSTDQPGVRVVMLSSSSAAEDRERARGAGAAAYLTKDLAGPAIADEVVRASSCARVAMSTGRAA